ncbi:MAG: GNAT family N-acetyltransferase [Bacteroidota bacterium]|nr:GNAT family N-acetyltransferase [Bacteroidota bacterium]
MIIKEPATPEEFEEYYTLRWKVLRQPWNKPKGSERDEMEADCIHAMAIDDNGLICGVIRLQQNSQNQAQVRYMAVDSTLRSKGVGSSLLKYIEAKAKEKKSTSIILHARENAIGFYLKNNYVLLKESYKMWEIIQHYEMKKEI